MKPHKILLALTILLTCALSVMAEEDENLPVAAKNNDIVKFAWEIPEYTELKNPDGSYMYPFAQSYAWSEIRHAGEAFVLMSQVRMTSNVDSQDFGASIAFRPFAIDFGTCAIAFGVSYGGQVFSEEDPDEFFPDHFEDSGFTFTGTDLKGNTASGGIQTLAFSTFGSFPTLGMQVGVDMGYAWTEATVESDRVIGNFNVEIGPFNFPAPLTYYDYHYRQRREGIFFRCEVRKFFTRDPDFNYLNFISVSFYTIYNRTTTLRHSRARRVTWDFSAAPGGGIIVAKDDVDLPAIMNVPLIGDTLLPDPADENATERSDKIIDGNVTAGDVMLRLYTSPPMDIGVIRQGLSIDFLGTVSHTTGEIFGDDLHGITLSMGGQLSLFDIVLISYTYTWEMNNDQSDFTTLAIGVGLYG